MALSIFRAAKFCATKLPSAVEKPEDVFHMKDGTMDGRVGREIDGQTGGVMEDRAAGKIGDENQDTDKEELWTTT